METNSEAAIKKLLRKSTACYGNVPPFLTIDLHCEVSRHVKSLIRLTLSLLPKLPFFPFENENLGVCIKKIHQKLNTVATPYFMMWT